MSLIRQLSRVGGSLLILATACTGGSTPPPEPTPTTASRQELVEAACALPKQVLLRTWRGFRPDRSGELQVIAKPFFYLDGGKNHSSPWPYTQDVPMFWYGPGHVPPTGVVERPVQIVDVAPTIGELVGFPFDAPDGQPMLEAVRDSGSPPPRLVVALVWDGAGRNVLDLHPDSWPHLKSLMPRGVWYDRGTVGSSPSVTPAAHASLGTGAYPNVHGLMDNLQRGRANVVTPFASGINSLLVPALADVYDVSAANAPLVGIVASVGGHMGMIGHGSAWEGGDEDTGVLNQGRTGGAVSARWNMPPPFSPFFHFPAYVRELPPITSYLAYADRIDGQIDGRWREEPQNLMGGWGTPARMPYQTRAMEEIIIEEGFGEDDVPDILFANYKLIDEVGHRVFANGVEMGDALRAQDAWLERFIRFLDREVGRRQWAMVITSDHGSQENPEVSGGFSILEASVEEDVRRKFGPNVLETIRPTQMFLDRALLRRRGHSVMDVAQFLASYTKGMSADVPEEEALERVFSAVIPASMMQNLPCLPPEARS